ncbi:MAG: hypothetical protein OEY86_09600 [Nitrospira sp.]|nr:hypothetical protein [Nitrospira sp.]
MLLAASAVLVFYIGQEPSYASAADSPKLEVRTDSGGGIRATAQVLFPARTKIIQGLLTDYSHWPDLFEVRMRIVDIQVESGIATVDLRIDHALMPGERRLVTETRVVSEGRLVTDLKDGDFRRYRRVWMLYSSDDGTQTRADFELVVEPELMIPDWLLVMVTRQELEAHFRLLTQKALEQTRLSSQVGPS